MSLKQINTDVEVTNTNPVHFGSVSIMGAERLDIQGKFAYVSGKGADNFVVVDISDPSTPVVIATVAAGGGNLLNNPYGIKAVGDRLYVSSEASNSLEIFDITDHANITRLGGITGLNGANEIAVQGNIVAVVSNIGDNVKTIDVSDPTAPVVLDTYSTDLNNVNALTIQGDYIYTGAPGAGSGDLFLVLDISDPANITLSGSVALADPHGFYASGRYVYVANNFSSTLLKVVDVSDPTTPVVVGSASSTEDAPMGITVAGNYAYITATNGDSVVVFDISDPTAPTKVGTIINGAGGANLDGPHGIIAVGKKLYVASSVTPFLEILDVAGLNVSHGKAGSFETNSLNVTEKAKIETLDVKNSLSASLALLKNLILSGNSAIGGGQIVNRTTVSDANYSVLLTDYIISLTSITVTRTFTLPTADGKIRKFIIKDESGNVGNFQLNIVVNGGGTIDNLTSLDVNLQNSTIIIYSDGTNYFTIGGISSNNAGQVKIITGNSVKPQIIVTAPTVDTWIQWIYVTPLGYSAYPTSTWPQNINIPVDADIYDFANDTFIENTIPGQVQNWRINIDYSGKPMGLSTGTRIRIRNTISGFSAEQVIFLPNETTSGRFTTQIATIADSASLPSPFGTGQGYVFEISADDPITFDLNSVVRISEKRD